MTPTSLDRILFVDDDAPVRTAFGRAVRAHGFEVDLADGAKQALDLAANNAYAVVASDYRMPEVNGLDLMSRLREMQPDATYILVSGQCDLELALTAVNNHAVAFVVPKPWDGDELGSMLRRGVEAFWERSAQSAVQRNMVDASRGLRQQKERLEDALVRSEVVMAEALLNAVEVRNFETRAHCQRVAAYAQIIAEEMGIRGHALVSIRHGALLHDVGMIAVPDDVVSKPSKLNDEERRLLRTHPTLGARILDGIETLRGARDIVMQHHERWDGSGYPRAFAGEEIVLGARIFAVADTLDAMLSVRPYKAPLPIANALAEIKLASGTLFDPQVIAAFVRVAPARWEEVRGSFPDETTAPAPLSQRHAS